MLRFIYYISYMILLRAETGLVQVRRVRTLRVPRLSVCVAIHPRPPDRFVPSVWRRGGKSPPNSHEECPEIRTPWV